MASRDLIMVNEPMSPIAEAYRTLRTNIQFSAVDEEIKTILVTSSGPSEGKTTVASNLAISMAENGQRTLMIDCDQRKPRVHRVFELSNKAGISDILAGRVKFEDAVWTTDINNLQVLTAGTRPPNPSELLASAKMKAFVKALKDRYDSVIIDMPPVIAVTDAQIVSKYVDGCILVAAANQAEKEAVAKSADLLRKVNAKVLGVVLNKMETKNSKYYGKYYHYYGSHEKVK